MNTALRSEDLNKNKVRALRQAHKMTQEELARSLGVTRQTVISIEKARYTPSLPLALKIAQVFNLKVDDIFSL